VFSGKIIVEFFDKGFEVGVIAGREAEEADGVETCGVVGGLCDFEDAVDAPKADGSAAEGGLAKTAAAGAASHNFDIYSLLDGLHKRDDRSEGDRGVVEILNDSVMKMCPQAGDEGYKGLNFVGDVRKLIKLRDVSPVECFGDFVKDGFFVSPSGFFLDEQFGKGNGGLFAFAENEQIEEISDRLAGVRLTSAADDYRVGLAAVYTAKRNMGEVEHIEDVGIAQFVGEAEADAIQTF
jgi:hypothetical protein